MKINLKEYGIFIALIVIGVILSIITPDHVFCSARNLTNLTRQVTFIGILAVGMTLVILLAEIDLSVGSLVAVTGVVAASLQVRGWGVIPTVLVTLLAGAILGMWNGFWISRYKIHSFIITLGMMVVARGLALILAKGASVGPTGASFQRLGTEFISPIITLIGLALGFVVWLVLLVRSRAKKRKYNIELPALGMDLMRTVFILAGFIFFGWVFSYKGIPLPVVVWIAIILAGIFILNNTTLGRHIYAVGGNIQAARLSGINTGKVKFLVYIIMGFLCAVSGILLTARLNGATPATLGVMYELDAIAAVVIGGTSLLGGIGHIQGTIVGAFLIGVLSNGMSLMGIPTTWQYVAKGLIIILAAWFDAKTKRLVQKQ